MRSDPPASDVWKAAGPEQHRHRAEDEGRPTGTAERRSDRPWWHDAVFYQIYIRSFADANGDGVGDLAGLRARLPYLRLLGVDAIWITPFYRSPMVDHGYDVADPRDVDPLFGDLAGFDALLRDAHDLGLKVTIDVVPNHTSDRHPWFQAALNAPVDSPARQRYVFRDGRGEDGALPPNNWPSTFGGPAWTRVPDGQWYLHLFAPQQPDLDWTNADVRQDIERTLRFWLDRGVDGFRIDVANGLVKPDGLPDFPRLAEGGDPVDGDRDIRFDAEGVHEAHRVIRGILDDYPDRVAVGEVWVTDVERLASYLRPDELHLVFNFRLLQSAWTSHALRTAIDASLLTAATHDAPACWVWSNHDVQRHVTRFGGGDVGLRRARAAALLQLALPGVVYLYQGDELGLPQVEVPEDARQDPIWERSGRRRPGRDGARVPIPWEGTEPPFGFSITDATWLPLPATWAETTVEHQLEDPRSILSLYRWALELRRDHPAFADDGMEWYAAPPECLAFRRTGGLVCVVNMSTEPVRLPPGEVLLTSVPVRDGWLPVDTTAWVYAPDAPTG